MTKKGLRELRLPGGGGVAHGAPRTSAERVLDLVLRHTVPAVRPDDVLTGLAAVVRT